MNWLKKFWGWIVDVPDYEKAPDKTFTVIVIPDDFVESIKTQPRQITINLNQDLLTETSSEGEKDGRIRWIG
jgi:hypothetical protein